MLEPLSGYLTLGWYLDTDMCEKGEAFNFGPRAEQTKTVLELTQDIASEWGFNPKEAAKITGNIPFKEATLLKLNCDKALAYLNWHSTLHYKQCVHIIAEWYKAFYIDQCNDMYGITVNQIEFYTREAIKEGLQWAQQ